MRRPLLLAAAFLLGLAALALFMFHEARSDPIVRRAEVPLPGLAAPLRVVLLSDIHIGTPAMDADRLDRIVAQVNALRPDLVAIAGDFIFGHDPNGAIRRGEALVGPLSRLRPRLGTVAVLGNHDYWTGAPAVRTQLARAHITLLENQAVVLGPLAVGGISDAFSRHDDAPATLRAARALQRPMLLLTHDPDIAPGLPEDALLLAGHTHCGQAMLFGLRVSPEVSRYGARYRCGIAREGNRTVIVTAGLGTSGVPLRIGAPPDLWLVTLVPAPQRAR